MGDKLTKKQVIMSLKRLNDGWPDGLWLFSASGTLLLMKYGEDGHAVMDGEVYDQNCIEESFMKIHNDGGDFWMTPRTRKAGR